LIPQQFAREPIAVGAGREPVIIRKRPLSRKAAINADMEDSALMTQGDIRLGDELQSAAS
jgi:hypothetical protein